MITGFRVVLGLSGLRAWGLGFRDSGLGSIIGFELAQSVMTITSTKQEVVIVNIH